MLYKKMNKKVSTLLIIAIVLIFVLLVYRKLNIRGLGININDVKSIKVTFDGAYEGAYYSSNPKFTVSDQENIKYIFNTIEASEKDGGLYKKYDMLPMGYNFTILLKNGNVKEYILHGRDVPTRNHMGKVLSSKEVVQQIRTAFTIDKSKINKVVYYYWENSKDKTSICEEVKDSVMIDKILEIAKKDVLKDPQKSMENTKSGFEFTDSNDMQLLVVNLRTDMDGYEELVKMLPKIAEHVK